MTQASLFRLIMEARWNPAKALPPDVARYVPNIIYLSRSALRCAQLFGGLPNLRERYVEMTWPDRSTNHISITGDAFYD